MAKTDYEKKLQEAIQHARQEPDIPKARIAELYEVNACTLRRRLAGKSTDYASAARDRQLFTTGEEKAIADYAIVMADAGFPLNHTLLREIAQFMVNERGIVQKGQRATFSLTGTTIPSTATSDLESSSLHIIGAHWVDRFLQRQPGLKKIYIRYQDRARATASNDVDLLNDFLRKLGNLIRRFKITADNLWNCDEKGITVGKNNNRTMAIVRAGGRSTAITEGSREFCSILETINAAGKVSYSQYYYI